MNDFHQIMSQRSDLELYRILHQESHKYKRDALEAAELEFEKRKMDESVLTNIKVQINTEKRIKKETKAKRKETKSKIFEWLTMIIPAEQSTIEKTTKSICLFIGLIYIIRIISNFWYFRYYLTDFSRWNWSTIIFLSDYIVIPFILYGLWQLKKYGWYLLTTFLTYLFCSGIFSIIDSYQLSLLQSPVYGPLSIESIIMPTLIIGIILFYFNKSKVLKVFGINKQNALILILSIVLIMVIVYGLLM